MRLDQTKLEGLFSRIVNGKAIETDVQDLVEYSKRVFGDGGQTPNIALVHDFNNLVVKQADVIARQRLTNILDALASYKVANRGDVVQYNIPQKIRAKVRWSANGSGVDLVRVENVEKEVAVPKTFSAGFYYEPFGMVQDAQAALTTLVDDLANAKVRLYFEAVTNLIDSAVKSQKVPATNILSGDNLTLEQYNKKASIVSRVAGGRPVFVADTLLIDHFALQQDAKYYTDRVKEQHIRDLQISEIGRTDAVNLINPFTDKTNSETELPVNVGYIIAGAANQRPFIITEFGGMRQYTEQSMEDERIKIKISQDADIQLIFGEAIVKVTENTAVTL